MYKVTNKLEKPLRFGKILFAPKETKLLKERPTSNCFHIEEAEEKKERKKPERRED